jgi:hypothetical protein
MKNGSAIIVSLGIVAFACVTLLANAGIMNFAVRGKKVHDAMKDGKKVNSCNYCHGIAKIEKMHQNLMKGQAAFGTLKNKPQCAGPVCHR